jgi:hypothetical protein
MDVKYGAERQELELILSSSHGKGGCTYKSSETHTYITKD